jgi:predicted CxxxxCH...CXXCH cytochrome family protein
MANDADQMCLDCHNSRNQTDHTKGTHPVGVTYPAGDPDFNAVPVNANPANPTSAMKLIGGKVSCSSCHGVHTTDSNSATFDSFSSQTDLKTSDGSLLRTDRKAATADGVNICTNCHTGKFTHNGRGQNVQCTDCHGAHVDNGDGSTPNVWLVRRDMGAGREKVQFTSTTSKNYLDANSKGVCQSCHAVPTAAGYQFHLTQTNLTCNDCHTHGNTLGSFAVDPNKACDSCHGYPPVANIKGAGGYASGYETSASFTDESKSGHASHASSPYQKACVNCHNGNTHQAGTFQDAFKDTTGTIAATGGLAPQYNATAQTCSAVYCHSNASPRGGTTITKTTPSWKDGKGKIVGTVGECGSCHSAAGDATPTWSVSHSKHINGYAANANFTCSTCHAKTAASNSAIFGTMTARALHTNGTKDVSFNSFASGGAWDTNAATCSTLYCHSDVQGADGRGAATSTTPAWNSAAMTCGSCHAAMVKLANISTATGSHKRHVQGYSFECSTCHGTGYSVVNTTVSIPTHVDGTITMALTGTAATNGAVPSYYQGTNVPGDGYDHCSNVYCHSNVQGNGGVGAPTTFAAPVWGAAIPTCGGCHANMATSAGASGSHVQHAQTAAYSCVTCHNGAGKDPNPPYTATAKHADGTIEISFSGNATDTVYSKGGSVTPGTGYGSCATSNCHGAASPVWGTNSAKAQCEKCHGSAGSAAFNSVAGNTTTTDTKAGAHTAHLQAKHGISAVIACAECHTVPATVNDVTHLNGTTEVPLEGTLANKSRTLPPAYNAATGECSNTYCHGGTSVTVGGTKITPVWKTPLFTGTAGTDCSLCHGYPPPTTVHSGFGPTNCQTCHTHVNPTGTGFGDVTKHLNGTVDASGGHDVPYYAHYQANTASCVNCHNVSAAGSYPAVSGPPNCRGCHTVANPIVANSGCTSCHTVPPNSDIAPNRAGSHAKHAVTAADCATCHSGFGTGSGVNHGPSNRGTVASSVNLAFDTAAAGTGAAWDSGNKNCSNIACHANPYGSGTSATPVWGTSAGCAACHNGVGDFAANGAPATGSHSSHLAATVNATCADCHAGAQAGISGGSNHANGTINVTNGYPATAKHAANSGYLGTCSTSVCHGGNSPVWGADSATDTCTKCHGTPTATGVISDLANNRNLIAPPTTVAGASGTVTSNVSNNPKVGAHQTHLQFTNGFSNYSTVTFRCENCHGTLPTSGNHASGSSTPSFKGLAIQGGMTRATRPAFNAVNLTCSNTYCHNPAASNVLKYASNTGSAIFPSWTSASYLDTASGAKSSVNCNKCHKVPGDAGFEPTAPHVGVTIATSCAGCHDHDGDTKGPLGHRHIDGVLFGGNCTGCHGYPPSTNTVGPTTGSASGYTTYNEATTPHTSHATQFTCDQCHKGNNHNSGTFTDVFKSPATTLAGSGATYTAPACNTVYCHSDGNGGFKAGQAAIAWGSNKLGTIIGQAGECTTCHENTAISSGSHTRHVTIKGLGCVTCHATTVSANTTLLAAAKQASGTHVNSVKDVKFSGIAGTGTSCATAYCHSSGQSTNGASATPVYAAVAPTWGGTAFDCGSCHATTGLTTGSHTKHFTGLVPSTNCGNCHTGATATAYSAATHVDGLIDVGVGTYTKAGAPGNGYGTCSTAACHNDPYSSGSVTTPVWGVSSGCSACHTIPIGVNGPATGSHDMHAGTACTSCHNAGTTANSIPSSGHDNGTINVTNGYPVTARHISGSYSGRCSTSACHGTSSPVWGANTTGATCVKCHGVSGTSAAAYTADPKTAAPGYNGTGVNIARTVGTLTGGVSADTKVGAHDTHLKGTGGYKLGGVACADCHAVTALTSAGHLDGSTTMAWSTLATNSGALTPAYTAPNCSTNYCHGASFADNVKGTGTTASWVNGGYLANAGSAMNATDCNQCHLSPPTNSIKYNHAGVTLSGAGSCSGCHSHDGFGDARHINGTLEAAGGACNSCHSYDTVGGVWGSGTHKDGVQAEGWGAHAKHIDHLKAQMTATLDPSVDTYGSAVFKQVCGACHSSSVSDHSLANSSARNINFDNRTTYRTGDVARPFYNGSSASIAKAKTCSNVSCHFTTTPLWQ